MVKKLGIDAGGTLTKIAYVNDEGKLVQKHFPTYEMNEAVRFIQSFEQLEDIGMTGGRAEQLSKKLLSNVNIHYMVEFEATLEGVRYLLDAENSSIKESIITNIGTGTSIHYMGENEFYRVGGTGVGGGTLTGLGALLTGMYDYDEISKAASKGNREQIDLLVADIFQGLEVPAPLVPNLTASNFGKIAITKKQQHTNEDLLASVARLVGEVITTLSIQIASQHDVEHIIFIGTTLTDHDVLKAVLQEYTVLKEKKPIFLNDRGFSGAIGALRSI